MITDIEHFSTDYFIAREQSVIRRVFLELPAIPYGIRTVWNGFLTAATMMHPPAREALESLIPGGCALYDSMSIGYPKNTHQRIPLRNQAIIK